jgi:lipopolysaccharide biosynthesis glycosyltransferase
MQARENAYIIHFASDWKPWIEPEKNMANVFWKYARLSPFYEMIFYEMISFRQIRKKKKFLSICYNEDSPWLIKKIIRFNNCIQENGINYTIKLLEKKIMGNVQVLHKRH